MSAPELSATEVASALERGELAAVDVREAGEWNAGHIAGAVWIPMGEFADRVSELPRRAAGDRLPQRCTQRRGGRLAGAVGSRRRQPGGRHGGLARRLAADRTGGRLDRVSVRVGTCSWADESLSKLWYPPGVSSAEARLRWYAEHFDTVEVNSSYYALPTEEMATAWAHRTPPGFVFHVKAFGMMTRHPVRVEQLPPDMRSEAEFDERGRIDRPSQELRSAVFRRFLRAVEPLREAGKLGGVLMQLPQYVVFKPSSFAYLEWAREQLTDHHMLVEFRHRSWLTDEHREQTLAFLERLPASYVIVDAPPVTSDNVAPTVVARTSDTAYLRLHGRNKATWNHRGGGAAKRFDYLYSRDELAEWVEPLRELAGSAREVFAMFNNNGRSTDVNGQPFAQAPANAAQLLELLDES